MQLYISFVVSRNLHTEHVKDLPDDIKKTKPVMTNKGSNIKIKHQGDFLQLFEWNNIFTVNLVLI